MTDQLIQALKQIPNGVYFLMSRQNGLPRGMVASWVSQVSGDPALVLVALHQNRGMYRIIEEQRGFSLGLIPQVERDLYAKLIRPGPERLQGLDLQEGPMGLPYVKGMLGVLFCRLKQVYLPGDHYMLLGRPEETIWQGGDRTLTTDDVGHYYLGQA